MVCPCLVQGLNRIYMIVTLHFSLLDTCLNYCALYNYVVIFRKHVHYDLHKYYFGNRIISIWNSLPDYVINVNTISVFEIG